MLKNLGERRVYTKIIYTLLILTILFPLVVPIPMPIPVSDITRDVYDRIEAVPEGGIIMFVMDIDPGGWGELADSAIAILTHVFRRPVRIMGVSADINGPIFWERLVENIIDKKGKEYGTDYVYLGYLVSNFPAWSAFADEIESVFEKDYYGTPLSNLPLMDIVKSHEDVDLIVTVDRGSGTVPTLYCWVSPYSVPYVCVFTGIMASQYIVYYPEQILGIVTGIRGAAEYEILIQQPGLAAAQTNVLSTTHLFIIGLIIIGNINEYRAKSKKQTMESEV